MPFISIIIPSFNRAATIECCLKSVLNQTYPDFEIVVVDDCSSDNTVKLVNGLGDGRIRCIVLEKNSGAQVARNVGIKSAKYEWIAFQDSDDEWFPDKLERQMSCLEKVNFNPFTVVHGNCFRRYAGNDKLVKWNLRPFEGENVFSSLLQNYGPLFPAILTSKKALEQIGFLDEKVPSFQEWDTAIRLSRICRFMHITEPLFIYNVIKADSISNDYSREIEGCFFIRSKYKLEIIKLLGLKLYLQLVAGIIFKAMEADLWKLSAKMIKETKEFTMMFRLKLRMLACLKIKQSKITKLKSFRFFGRQLLLNQLPVAGKKS